MFPGTWSDTDCFHVLADVLHQPVDYVWHKETDLSAYDCVILPGGFSYGDYLRAGAIARFSPVTQPMDIQPMDIEWNTEPTWRVRSSLWPWYLRTVEA